MNDNFFGGFFSGSGGGSSFAQTLTSHTYVERIQTNASTHYANVTSTDGLIVSGAAMVVLNGLVLLEGEDFSISESVTSLAVTLLNDVHTGDILQVKYLCFHQD